MSTEHDLPCVVTAVLTCRLVPVRVLVSMSGVDGGEGVVLLSSPQEREEVVERTELRLEQDWVAMSPKEMEAYAPGVTSASPFRYVRGQAVPKTLVLSSVRKW